MPGFRFPVSIPKSLGELFERIRELLPQLEAKVLPNRLIGTTETKIAHGLKSTPVFVVPSHPHCIAIVKETRRADHEFIYLKATNLCVVNVWTLAIGQLGRSLVPDGGYKLPDWNPEGLDDHEVKADSADTGHGPLKDKLKDTATLTWQVDTTGGVHTVKGNVQGIPAADDHLVKARTADATTVGGLMEKTIDSDTITRELTTEGGVEKVRFNATPATPPAGEGSWLYTGSIQASNLKDPVKAFVKSLEGMGGLDPGQSELFTVLENGDFEHKAVGQLYGLAPDGTETFALSAGQRVWLTMWLGAADSTYHGGFCTVQTLGDGSTKAVLRPTGESVVVGDMFTVEGVGAEYEGWYWEILSLPEKTLAYRPEYVNATTYNLFTSTNVDRAGTATRETSVTIPGGTSGGTPFAVFYFEMLDVLGVSTIPKGVVNWKVKAYVVADDPAATIFIRANLTTDQGVSHNLGYADTPPMHNTSAAVLDCQGTIPADLECNPSDKLGAIFYAHSNSASAITVRLVFNDASHSTRVQTPLTTASFGTLDHRLLTPTTKGWSSGQEKWWALFEHPDSTVCKRFPVDCSATIETGDGAGVLVIPDNCSGPVRVTGTELRAIAVKDADGNVVFGKLAGLRLHFEDTCTIRHLDTLSGLTAPWIARAAKIHLLPPIGAVGTDMDLQIPALRTVRFYLDQPSGGVLTWYIEASQ